jgi:hypothetical protein
VDAALGSVHAVAPRYIRANDVYVAVEDSEITAFYALTLHGSGEASAASPAIPQKTTPCDQRGWLR